MATKTLGRIGEGWGTFRIIPMESGRGCPYGCEFCTVTGFLVTPSASAPTKRSSTNLLLLKARAKKNAARSPSLHRRQFRPSISNARISSCETYRRQRASPLGRADQRQFLRDEELVDLIAQSGGKWVFIGMESSTPPTSADVNKGFNKPGEYAAVLQRLAQRNVYAITSLFSAWTMTRPVSPTALSTKFATWPPGLPIFGLLTPLPATPLTNASKPLAA